MPLALTQQTKFAISYGKQLDLVTALNATKMWSLRATAVSLHANPINEDDATDLGKGVYATTTFPSHIEAGGAWNGRITSEALAQLIAFAGGTVVQTPVATGGFGYTVTAPDLTVVGLDLPVATIVESIGSVSDKMLIGVACEEFGISLKSGPGRDNATFTSNWLGTGKFLKPSGIILPAPYAEHSMTAGSLTTLNLAGFDYLANRRFVSADFTWKNNIRDASSYFPGSGNQAGFQLRGRIRRGVPTLSLKCTVECDSGSSEEDTLLAQTEGSGTIVMTGPAGAMTGAGRHLLSITFPRLRVKAASIGDSDGIASYQLDYSILQDSTLGVCTILVQCEQNGLLT